MGTFADDVNARLRAALAERRPEFDWETEYPVGSTRADVGGETDAHLVLVELEWRRADPADNTAKLFRHLSEGRLDFERVSAFQVFTGYYDLASGGVSSKRENAEFVGRVAADSFEYLSSHPVEFDLVPPKRGGERPGDWPVVADETVDRLLASL